MANKLKKSDYNRLKLLALYWIASMTKEEEAKVKEGGLSYDEVQARFPELSHTQREYIRGFVDGSLGHNS